MGMVFDRFEPSVSRTLYIPTDKEPSSELMGSERDWETLYWTVAGRIRETLGEDGVTLDSIYHRVTGPSWRWSLEETRGILKSARDKGYLTTSRPAREVI